MSGQRALFVQGRDEVATVGAHDVEVMSVMGKHFAFFSNDKDERTTKQDSELFEWVASSISHRL